MISQQLKSEPSSEKTESLKIKIHEGDKSHHRKHSGIYEDLCH